jgi:tetratricopeptide (TPR) repeat protein
MLSLAGSIVAQSSAQSSAADQLQGAQQALLHDHIDEALSILQSLPAADSHSPGLQRELGRVYYRAGQLEEAKAAFGSAIQDDSNDREAIQMEGLVLYRMGQQNAAIPYLERVRQWEPGSNADANYVLALCYLNAHRLDEARTAFARQFGMPADSAGSYLLLALSRSLPMAHFILGELALQEDNIPRAIQEFDAERQINPNYAPAYDRLEECYLRTDKLEEAQQALIRAIALDRSDTDAFIKMGKVLLSKHDVQTAIMYLKIAEKMVPNDFTPHVLLARAYHLPGQEGDARREADLAEQDHAAGQTPLQPAK